MTSMVAIEYLFASPVCIVSPQKAIPRYVIEQGMFVKHCKVEVYLMDLKLTLYPKVDDFKQRQFSRSNTIGSAQRTKQRRKSGRLLTYSRQLKM